MQYTQLITKSSYGPQNTQVICFLADSWGQKFFGGLASCFPLSGLGLFQVHDRHMTHLAKMRGNLQNGALAYQRSLPTANRHNVTQQTV
jgi:hypothetical protein